MRPDDLIIRLNRLGYRTQVIGGQIVILFRGGSSLSGTREQIEKLLPQLSKGGGKNSLISALPSAKQSGPKQPADRVTIPDSPISAVVVGENSVSIHPRKEEREPTYAELLAKLKRLEAERDTRLRLENKGETRKKKKNKKKRKRSAKMLMTGTKTAGGLCRAGFPAWENTGEVCWLPS
jgi:hypothetical protein